MSEHQSIPYSSIQQVRSDGDGIASRSCGGEAPCQDKEVGVVAPEDAINAGSPLIPVSCTCRQAVKRGLPVLFLQLQLHSCTSHTIEMLAVFRVSRFLSVHLGRLGCKSACFSPSAHVVCSAR